MIASRPVLKLRLASCMAENSERLCRRIASHIEELLGIPAECVDDVPWQERERLFDDGSIQILWLCGLPYADKFDHMGNHIELLALPVPGGSRYRGQPVYFSDVIVRREHPARSFADLRGSTWAYNEPRSHSGFNVVRSYLADIAEGDRFFGRVIQSGAHSASLAMVLSGRADGTAIDSTVLEWLIRHDRHAADRIRILKSLGPSPIPPWVVSRKLPVALRGELRSLLLTLHNESRGMQMLAEAGFERFVAGSDGNYDPIRSMAAKAERISLA